MQTDDIIKKEGALCFPNLTVYFVVVNKLFKILDIDTELAPVDTGHFTRAYSSPTAVYVPAGCRRLGYGVTAVTSSERRELNGE